MTRERPIRYRCELFAELELHGQPRAAAQVVDLSIHGAFIEEPSGLIDPQVSDTGFFTIALPATGPWRAAVTVTRLGNNRRELHHLAAEHLTVTVRGMALEFSGLDPAQRTALERYLEQLEEQPQTVGLTKS